MKTEIVCYCGSLRVALDAFKKAEYEAVLKGEIALLPCCMFVDIEREYGVESDYKTKADDLHKRKIDIADKVFILNVGGYIGQSTRSEIDYALSISKPVEYLEPIGNTSVEINEVLKILNENYEASKKIEDKKEREILIETYEDLIAIFNHKRNLAE